LALTICELTIQHFHTPAEQSSTRIYARRRTRALWGAEGARVQATRPRVAQKTGWNGYY